jgi:hypothetical protein
VGIGREIRRARRLAGDVLDQLRALHPAARARAAALQAERACSEASLRRFSDAAVPGDGTCLAGTVLVDGTWDNPNYWFRVALMRRALGLAESRVVGLVGAFARREVAASFARLTDGSTLDFREMSRIEERHRAAARTLLAPITTAADLLRAKLPNDLPCELFYDGVLKRQRRGVVDLKDPLIVDLAAEQLACIEAAENVFEEVKPDIVLLSHGLNFTCGALVWEAVRRGVPVVVLYGDFGTTRFVRLFSPKDLFVFPSRPSLGELASLSSGARADLIRVGREQLALRKTGRTNDLGARYAFAAVRGSQVPTRTEICTRFGWDPTLPIIGIYASNPFDYPHCTGMYHFRDFIEWNRETIAAAARNKRANFLAKPHPIDRHYGLRYGEGLSDVVRETGAKNIQLAEEFWKGADFLRLLDGAVTHHGSVGYEAAALGVPVMTTDHAWYDEIGFVKRPPSKAAYLAKLESEWWLDWPREAAAEAANLAIGLYFGVPDWQGGYVLRDDSDQWLIYGDLENFLARHSAAIERETALIRDWYLAKHPFFHMYKIFHAERFRVGNAVA